VKKYSQTYTLQKVKQPLKEGQNYSVTHYVPIDGGTALALRSTKYFKTEEEAAAYKKEREEALAI